MKMDPNMFHLDWERTIEVLTALVVLSMMLERALAVLFETRIFVDKAQGRSVKEIIAFVVAGMVCWYWDFDAMSMIFVKDTVTVSGAVITGAIVAGGTKGS